MPRLRLSVLIVTVVTGGAILAGCNRSPSKVAPDPTPISTPVSAPSPVTSSRPTTDAQEHRSSRRKELALLFDGKYDALEAEAARLQTSSERLRDGSWQRKVFYESLSCPNSQRNPDWAHFEKALLEWQKSYPESDAARLALAQFYIDYAWKARGSGYANSVTEENWRIFFDRLRESHRLLADIRSPEYRNESYWQSMLTLARGLQIPKEEVLAEVNKALSTSPHRTTILRNTVIYLLPRWFGEPGEWQTWLAQQTQGADKDPERDAEYALAAGAAIYYVGLDDGPPFAASGVDWPRVRRGLLLREKQFPNSLGFKSNLLLMAYYAGDKATAREVDARCAGRYEPNALDADQIEEIHDWLDAAPTTN